MRGTKLIIVFVLFQIIVCKYFVIGVLCYGKGFCFVCGVVPAKLSDMFFLFFSMNRSGFLCSQFCYTYDGGAGGIEHYIVSNCSLDIDLLIIVLWFSCIYVSFIIDAVGCYGSICEL